LRLLEGTLERLECGCNNQLCFILSTHSTTSDEERQPLLVHTLLEESQGVYADISHLGRQNLDQERSGSTMEAKGAPIKTSAVETTIMAAGTGSNYRKTADDYVIGGPETRASVEAIDSNERELTGPAPTREDLAMAIQEIEGKTKWYAYLLTWDFWTVLIIGYVFVFEIFYCCLEL
jgi:hypothetical protein